MDIEEENMEFAAETYEDSSGSSSDEEVNFDKVQELTDKLVENPYEYTNHVELITLLKEAGELEKLRDARNAMAQIFPLSEKLWLDWIQDEIKLASTDTEKETVVQLLDRAVVDYLSVDIWLEYCQFTIGGIGTEEGLAKARGTYERAVRFAGLHVTRGSLIWDSYRVFENALLQSLQPEIGIIQTSDEQKKLEDQTKRVESIFKRQLSVPLLNMEETYEELKQFVTEAIPKDLTDDYNKALSQLKACNRYEMALSKAEAPRLAEYENYIKAIQSKGNADRLQCLYERALVENWQSATMWKAYTVFVDNEYKDHNKKELKDDENAFYEWHQPLEHPCAEMSKAKQEGDEEMKDGKPPANNDDFLAVHQRSVRNCTWSAELWISYIQALERLKQPYSQVQAIFEDALLAGFSNSSDYLDMWMSYLAYLKRQIEWKTGGIPLQTFCDTAQRAIDFMNQYFGFQGDALFKLQRYWAKVESHYNNNVKFGRKLWKTILDSDNGYKTEYWLEYYQFELKYGDLVTCREVLHDGVDKETEWPERICEVLLNFEREHGSLRSFDEASSKVQSILGAQQRLRSKAARRAKKKKVPTATLR